MTGVAVNVTAVPEQIVVPEPEAIVTDGVTEELTLMVMLFDVAVEAVAQLAVDVITQVTTSLFANAVVV